MRLRCRRGSAHRRSRCLRCGVKTDLEKPNGQIVQPQDQRIRHPRIPRRPALGEPAARSALPDRSMNHFHYKDGVLCAEDVPLDRTGRRGRHAFLLLFHRHADAALQGLSRPRCPKAR